MVLRLDEMRWIGNINFRTSKGSEDDESGTFRMGILCDFVSHWLFDCSVEFVK